MASATRSGSSASVAGSTSTKTGRAPSSSAAVAEATKENAGVITSVSGPTPSACKDELDRVRARADADRVAHAQIGGALRLEGLALGAEDELAAPQHVPDRRLDLRLELLVLPREVELRNLHCVSQAAEPPPEPILPQLEQVDGDPEFVLVDPVDEGRGDRPALLAEFDLEAVLDHGPGVACCSCSRTGPSSESPILASMAPWMKTSGRPRRGACRTTPATALPRRRGRWWRP